MNIYVQKNGERVGPFDEHRVRQGIDAGEWGAEDLAWTKGKASWQPLSVLIDLNLEEPPPLPDNLSGPLPNGERNAVERGMQKTRQRKLTPLDASAERCGVAADARSTDGSGTSTPTTVPSDTLSVPSVGSGPQRRVGDENEANVLYNDNDVTVTGKRLKVGNESYLLNNVSSVSIQTNYKRYRVATLIKGLCLWMLVAIILLGEISVFLAPNHAPVGFGTFIIFGLLLFIPGHFAMAAMVRDVEMRYWEMFLVLGQERASQIQIPMGSYGRHPDDISRTNRWYKNDEVEHRKQIHEHVCKVDRIQAITEAIGKAIEKHS